MPRGGIAALVVAGWLAASGGGAARAEDVRAVQAGSTASVAAGGSATPAAAAPGPAVAPVQSSDDCFFVRLGEAFWTSLNSPAFVASPTVVPGTPPASKRRVPKAPFDSPPYPVPEFFLGGTPTIGDPNVGAPYPTVLMQALYGAPFGEWLRESRLQIYGWINPGANVSSSHESNLPVGYFVRPNEVELDQIALYFDRRPDEAQQDELDWGFRFASIYGLDYRFTTMKGILSEQLLNANKDGNPPGNLYGYDPIMAYVDLYIPFVAEGMNIRAGRFISLPDIEAQLAPDNLMYSHSILYAFDIFTQIGIVATVKLTDSWTVQLGIAGGNDIAPWEHRAISVPEIPERVPDHGAQPTLDLMVQWISADAMDSIYAGVNGINDGDYGYNNIQECPIGTWTHKFDETFWMATEAYYMFERNVPLLGFTWEVGAVNYFVARLSGDCFLTLRNEFFDDGKGQRTGHKTIYSEHTVGVTYWFNRIMTFRPEVRFDHAYNLPAYDNGTRRSQVLLAADLIFHF